MSICESRVQLYYSQPKYDDDASRGRRAMNSISTDWDCFKVRSITSIRGNLFILFFNLSAELKTSKDAIVALNVVQLEKVDI